MRTIADGGQPRPGLDIGAGEQVRLGHRAHSGAGVGGLAPRQHRGEAGQNAGRDRRIGVEVDAVCVRAERLGEIECVRLSRRRRDDDRQCDAALAEGASIGDRDRGRAVRCAVDADHDLNRDHRILGQDRAQARPQTILFIPCRNHHGKHSSKTSLELYLEPYHFSGCDASSHSMRAGTILDLGQSVFRLARLRCEHPPHEFQAPGGCSILNTQEQWHRLLKRRHACGRAADLATDGASLRRS
jgi:hypothetical protein